MESGRGRESPLPSPRTAHRTNASLRGWEASPDSMRPPNPLPWRPHNSTAAALRCHHRPPRWHLGPPWHHQPPGTPWCPRWGGHSWTFPCHFCPLCLLPVQDFTVSPLPQQPNPSVGARRGWRIPLRVPWGGFGASFPAGSPDQPGRAVPVPLVPPRGDRDRVGTVTLGRCRGSAGGCARSNAALLVPPVPPPCPLCPPHPRLCVPVCPRGRVSVRPSVPSSRGRPLPVQ